MIKKYDLMDVFRERMATAKRCPWSVKNPSLKQARLDFFLISGSINEKIVNFDIKPGYRTDHSVIEMDMIVVDQEKGRGLYKFNVLHLKDREYVRMVKRIIMTTVMRYALPVYEHELIEISLGKPESLEVCYSISDICLYETVKLNIRTETITYSINKKKQMRSEEPRILAEINDLEIMCSERPSNALVEELCIKQDELVELRKPLIDGLIVRSRMRWYEMAEKSNKYFLNLEERNYTSKITPALKNESGVVITDQGKIINMFEEHFRRTCCNHDSGEDPHAFVSNLDLGKINEQEAAELGSPFSLNEVNTILRNMKQQITR